MLNYNAPVDGNKSTIDEGTNSEQMRTFFWLKKALIEARKEQYFMPLASAINMPKHYGKHIKCYEYIPLLDDRNVNDEGIDAEGAVIEDGSGNLYGSSRDIGTINKNLPTLSENGGRVNRVGFSRIQFEGTIQKFGFFYEFTQESLDFDSDDGLKEHLAREAMNGAVQLTEAVLQKDLLAAAGVVVYPGSATADNEVTGEGSEPTVLDYETLMRLDQILTENRTPMHTKVITGSRLVDTKVIPSARVLYCSADLVRHMKSMKDLFNNKAFIEVQHYADAGNILHGEVGSIDHFRIVQVPEMLHWAGAGAQVKDEGTKYKHTDGKYDVYPLLCLGDDSWSTIGFQTDGKSLKFNVMTKMPGRETADRMTDPYGETGFSSIKWYYGFLLKRPHRIGLIKCVAPI